MSILDTVFRRREPAVKYRTVDGGHPAPYPDMTDEQLYNYEMTFNVPKKTFDKPPGEVIASRVAVSGAGRNDPDSRDQRMPDHGQAGEPLVTAFRTTGLRTNGARTGTSGTGGTGGATGRTRPGTPHAPGTQPEADLDTTRTIVRERVATEESRRPAGPLDLSKPVRTITTKQPVEIITTRARHPLFKVLGYIGDDQVVTMFTLDGQISENGPRFLENVPQKQSLYLNIYPNRSMGGRERFFVTQHDTREAADAAAMAERIACVPVEFDL